MALQGETREQGSLKTREPKQYNVVMINDDFTTMEFVVDILMTIFHKDALTAETIMMQVHKAGSAVVGKYPYDIAATKVEKALARAKEEGFPFRMSVEEE